MISLGKSIELWHLERLKRLGKEKGKICQE
jgi:hypothetical protein